MQHNVENRVNELFHNVRGSAVHTFRSVTLREQRPCVTIDDGLANCYLLFRLLLNYRYGQNIEALSGYDIHYIWKRLNVSLKQNA